MALESKSVDETVNEGINAVDDAEIGADDIITFVKDDGNGRSLKKQSMSGFQGAIRLSAEQLNAGQLDEARLPGATRQKKGAIRIALAADMEAGTDDTLAVTPARVRAQVGAKVAGGEKTDGTMTSVRRYSPRDVKDMVATHAGPSIPAASTAARGTVWLANEAEVQAGTDAGKAVTAAGLQSRIGAAEGQLAVLNPAGEFEANRIPALSAAKIDSGMLDPQRFMYVQDATPGEATEGTFWLRGTTGRLRQYLKYKRLFLFSSLSGADSLTVVRLDGTVDEATGRDFGSFSSEYNEYKSLAVTDTRVYILRSDRGEVDVYNLDDLSLDTSFAIPAPPTGHLPKGMAVGSDRVYIVGHTAGTNAPWMRVTDLAGTRQASEEFNLDAANADPQGVEVVADENRAYVYDDDGTQVYVYDLPAPVNRTRTSIPAPSSPDTKPGRSATSARPRCGG